MTKKQAKTGVTGIIISEKKVADFKFDVVQKKNLLFNNDARLSKNKVVFGSKNCILILNVCKIIGKKCQEFISQLLSAFC